MADDADHPAVPGPAAGAHPRPRRSRIEAGPATDPADEVALADTVGVALHLVLERLSPGERVAFVLHDSFGYEFSTIAAVLDTTPAAARKLASRARARIGQPAPEDHLADWQVVDAFVAAARHGDFQQLLRLLAPDAAVRADDAAVHLGTPERLDGRLAVATFFDGSASAALPVLLGDRPAAAWFHRGAARVVFDLSVADGVVERITFRAEPDVLEQVVRREGRSRAFAALPDAWDREAGRPPGAPRAGRHGRPARRSPPSDARSCCSRGVAPSASGQTPA